MEKLNSKEGASSFVFLFHRAPIDARLFSRVVPGRIFWEEWREGGGRMGGAAFVPETKGD